MDPALSPFPAVPTHFVRIPAGRDLTCASVRDSETLRADHVAPAPRFTRAQFERFVDDVFESEKSRASASFVSRFSQAWKIRAKTRFLVGAALAAGSAAALVSGAPAVAGGFLALRAAMGGMGGYFAAESAFDLVAAKIGADPFSRLLRRISQVSSREELDADVREIFDRYEASEIASGIETAKARAERFRGVRRVAAATVGCVFAVIGGSAAAEAATSAVSSVASSVPEIPAVPSLSANSPATEVSEKVASVLADVRHDHPGRPVTLEQAVRRVEGLGRGVPLAQSARLRESVQDASAIVSDPNGKIADAMQRLGYLEPGGSPLRAASRLTEKKISAVLELAYADGADAPSVSDSTVDAPDAPAMAPEDSAATPVPSVRNPSHPEASAMPPSVSPHVHGPAERFADHVPTFSDGARKFLERVGTGAFWALSGALGFAAGIAFANRQPSSAALPEVRNPPPSDPPSHAVRDARIRTSEIERAYRVLDSGNSAPLSSGTERSLRRSGRLPAGSVAFRAFGDSSEPLVAVGIPAEKAEPEDLGSANGFFLPKLRFGGERDYFVRFWKPEPVGFFRRIAGTAPEFRPVSVREVRP